MRRATNNPYLLGLALAGLISGCALKNQDSEDQSGICIHSTNKNTYANASCTGDPTTANIYTYCTEETKEANCSNKSAACTNNIVYDDTNIYYKGKKCGSSGYTINCPNNANNKVSDTVYCPP